MFGPVAPVITFGTEDEASRWRTPREFGLVAYVYTRDIARALRLAESVETGMLGVNRGLVSDAARRSAASSSRASAARAARTASRSTSTACTSAI